MKNEIQEFREFFDTVMGEFIDLRLREISYQAADYAQKIGNSYLFRDDKTLLKARFEVEHFLDCLEKNLMDSRPSLEENINNRENCMPKDSISEDI